MYFTQNPAMRHQPLLIALLLISGCGTAGTLNAKSGQTNLVYSGVREETHPLSPHTFLDLPFSLVADTVVLPYTIPRTVYIQSHPATQSIERPTEKY
jgi:uncharacterized protein YceK